MRTLNGPTVTQRLKNFDLRTLFIQELGWDHGGPDADVTVGNRTFTLQAIAHTRGMVAYQYVADVDDVFPDHPTRRKIERAVAKTVREHVIVYPSRDRNALYWQWVTRKQGRSDRSHTSIYHLDHPDDALIRKLEQLVCTPDEKENNPNVADGSDRMLAAFDVEKVIRQFYDRLKKQRDRFQGFIKGIPNLADQEWYASLMLNRIMFLYFIQKGEFLDGDPDYLRNRLERIQWTRGKDRLQRFYRSFLLKLFHEGLSRPEAERAPESAELLGTVPYLNGGLFDVHDLERDNPDIRIPDKAFGKIFAFFDAYQWRLDDRPLRNDNEINLDVLGSIFEKYVNQKQMVAYYTKEDVTGYISRNTILPFLFHRVKQDCSIAFKPDGGVWRLLADDPDRYVYDAVRHGITYDVYQKKALAARRELPSEIAAGLNDVAHRGGWNETAPPEYALPTETWREHVARRQRYEEVRAKLAAGEVTSINDLITDNLDIEQFAQDVIANSEGPELVRAFWKALNAVSILDPTCGSGAFLIAAMNVLEPMYVACLDAMRGHLDDLTRSTHTHGPEHLNDFRTILDRAATRAGERDFILKSIMVNNVYGVDLMDEAVELCKLRLLLKLFAETSPDRIEPLPDVALNVRAGNTLVGFTSIKDIQEAFAMTQGDQRNMFSPEDTIDLTRIEAHAEAADLAFRRVRAMQAEHGVDAGAFARVKSDRRERLDDLRHEFDEYLAGNDGVKTTDEEAYRQWRHSHRPFHWFIEFYGIMNGGGFDVLIGNPPYLKYSRVKGHDPVKGYATRSCGNLFALVMERSMRLSHSESFLSMMVPLSGHSTKKMLPLMNTFYQSFTSCHLFNISADAHPGVLLPGARFKLAIFITSNRGQGIFTTGYSRWYAAEGDHPFSLLHYTPIGDIHYPTAIPKVSSPLHRRILQKLYAYQESPHDSLSARPLSDRVLLYHSSPVNWIRAHTTTPYFYNQRDGEKTSVKLKPLYQNNGIESLQGILCSTVFFIWWLSHSDCCDLNRQEIETFPKCQGAKFVSLSRRLEDDMRVHAKRRCYPDKTTGKIEYDEFVMKTSKPLIDDVDAVLAEHYGFTDEELDFIINYDIKYRMGLNNLSSDGE